MIHPRVISWIPLIATTLVLVGLYTLACFMFERFFQVRVVSNFFGNSATLGVVAVGMTFVILSGGIDLSVGAVVGLASVLMATLIESSGLHPAPAALIVILFGTIFGGAMGGLIHAFVLPPFIVTLAGMFLARGLAFVISGSEAHSISHPFFNAIYEFPARIAEWLGLAPNIAALAPAYVPMPGVIFILVLFAGIIIARYTRFGRSTYAIGGNEHAARLMGLPVGRTKASVYAASGFCAALGGVVYTLTIPSGDPNAGVLLELDAIAAVVIGGTLLSGGVGSVAGTLLGVLIFAVIKAGIDFEGSLDPWWARIAIGAILLGFILLQKALQRYATG